MSTNCEGTQPGQLIWTDQSDGPYYITSCLSIKAGERRAPGVGCRRCSETGWVSIWVTDLLRSVDLSDSLCITYFFPLFPSLTSSSQPTSFFALVLPVLSLIALRRRRSEQAAVCGLAAGCGQLTTEFKNNLRPAWREISYLFLWQVCIYKHVGY